MISGVYMHTNLFRLAFAAAAAIQTAKVADIKCQVKTLYLESVITPRHGLGPDAEPNKKTTANGVVEITSCGADGKMSFLMGFNITPRHGKDIGDDPFIDFHLPNYQKCDETLYEFSANSLFSLSFNHNIKTQVSDDYDSLCESTLKTVSARKDYRGTELESLLQTFCDGLNMQGGLIPKDVVALIMYETKEQSSKLAG